MRLETVQINIIKVLLAVTSSGADSQSFDGSDYTVEHFTATGSSTYTS